MYLLSIQFAQAASGGAGSPYTSFIMFGALILVFWLFMIRPQAKKAKDQKKFISQIEKGDKIVTVSGMHGTIFKLSDDNTSFVLETASKSQIQMERSAISLELTKSYYPKTEDASKLDNKKEKK